MMPELKPVLVLLALMVGLMIFALVTGCRAAGDMGTQVPMPKTSGGVDWAAVHRALVDFDMLAADVQFLVSDDPALDDAAQAVAGLREVLGVAIAATDPPAEAGSAGAAVERVVARAQGLAGLIDDRETRARVRVGLAVLRLALRRGGLVEGGFSPAAAGETTQ